MTGKSLSTNKVTHIGLIVRDVEKMAAKYAEMFGVEVPRIGLTGAAEETRISFKGKTTSARAKLVHLDFGSVRIELIEPVGGPSVWQEFLDARGECIHHVGIHSNKPEEDIAFLKGKSMGIVQQGEYPGGMYIYFDTERELGFSLELLRKT